jgi:hypothetical protein
MKYVRLGRSGLKVRDFGAESTGDSHCRFPKSSSDACHTASGGPRTAGTGCWRRKRRSSISRFERRPGRSRADRQHAYDAGINVGPWLFPTSAASPLDIRYRRHIFSREFGADSWQVLQDVQYTARVGRHHDQDLGGVGRSSFVRSRRLRQQQPAVKEGEICSDPDVIFFHPLTSAYLCGRSGLAGTSRNRLY